jgi:hypothetical protein
VYHSSQPLCSDSNGPIADSPPRKLLALRISPPLLLTALLLTIPLLLGAGLSLLPLTPPLLPLSPLLLLAGCSALWGLEPPAEAPPAEPPAAVAAFAASCAAFLSMAFWQGMTPTRGVPLAGAGDMLSDRACAGCGLGLGEGAGCRSAAETAVLAALPAAAEGRCAACSARMLLLLRLLYAPPPEDVGRLPADTPAAAGAAAGIARGLLPPRPLDAADVKGSGLRP